MEFQAVQQMNNEKSKQLEQLVQSMQTAITRPLTEEVEKALYEILLAVQEMQEALKACEELVAIGIAAIEEEAKKHCPVWRRDYSGA